MSSAAAAAAASSGAAPRGPVDGPRGVQALYSKVIMRLKEACKEDFRNDGIDQQVLDTMLQLWFNSLRETRVMHDDLLGPTDRKGQPRPQGQRGRAPPRPEPQHREEISKEMKRQIEDIIMVAADAVITPQLTQLLQQHSTDAMRTTPTPGSVKILQSHGWDGSRFLGRVDGTLLRKLADALVVYVHRSTTEAVPQPAAVLQQPLAGAAAAAAAAASAAGGGAAAAAGGPAASATMRIPQTDGADDGDDGDPAAKRQRTRYGEESSDDDEDAEDGGAAAAAGGDGAGGESDLNSDDDDLLSEAEEETSLILCQYKRVKKSKNKYTLDLQNGVMRIFLPNFGDYGREYVFSRAQANLDWGK